MRRSRTFLARPYPAMPDAQVTLDYLCDNIWIVGSPATVARKIAALSDTVGGFGMVLAIAHEWQPREGWERSMTLLSSSVELARSMASMGRGGSSGGSSASW